MPASPTTRVPLEETTNEHRTPTPSPPQASAKKGPVLRRKPSHHALHPQLDSSESYPSPHESIYEATVANASAENIDWYDAKDCATSTSSRYHTPMSWQDDDPRRWSYDDRPTWENTIVDASGNAVPMTFLQEPLSPKEHTPHKLYPITEQNSLATLRTGASFSTLKVQPSASTMRPLSPGLQGKKRKSFSLSDLPPTPHLLPTTKTPSPPPSPQSFYTPKEPHQPPPLRIPTPPGLPTFNAPAASNFRLPPPVLRFRDRFRPPTAAEREWAQQTIGLPRGVVMRGEGGVLVRGKFVPIRSGHFPPQKQRHVLYRMPGENSESPRTAGPPRPINLEQRHVRFTGPRTNPVSTTGNEEVSATVMGEDSGRKTKEERSEKILKRLYWVMGCCGLCEKWDLSAQNTDGSRDTVHNASAPLFVGGTNAMVA